MINNLGLNLQTLRLISLKILNLFGNPKSEITQKMDENKNLESAEPNLVVNEYRLIQILIDFETIPNTLQNERDKTAKFQLLHTLLQTQTLPDM